MGLGKSPPEGGPCSQSFTLFLGLTRWRVPGEVWCGQSVEWHRPPCLCHLCSQTKAGYPSPIVSPQTPHPRSPRSLICRAGCSLVTSSSTWWTLGDGQELDYWSCFWARSEKRWYCSNKKCSSQVPLILPYMRSLWSILGRAPEGRALAITRPWTHWMFCWPSLNPLPSLQANLFPAALVHFGAEEPTGE